MAKASGKHKKIKFRSRLSERLGSECPANREEEGGFGVEMTQQALSGHDFQLSTHSTLGWLESSCKIPTSCAYNLITVLFLSILLLLPPCTLFLRSL